MLETVGVDAIIMDDGFQNPSLKKDLSIAVVDGGAGIGCERVFPLGPLRARLAFQLAMADTVVILGPQDRTNVAELIEQRSQQFRSAPLPVFGARIVPAVRDELRGRPFLAFCGIGRPAKFFDTLREAGIAVVKTRSFPDHHPYADADALSLLTEANALNAGLITTEKDHARLKIGEGALGELYQHAFALPITVKFSEDGEARLLKLLSPSLSRKGLAPSLGSPKAKSNV